jgi:hypothetical protein
VWVAGGGCVGGRWMCMCCLKRGVSKCLFYLCEDVCEFVHPREIFTTVARIF